jgi:hypothetical protein
MAKMTMKRGPLLFGGLVAFLVLSMLSNQKYLRQVSSKKAAIFNMTFIDFEALTADDTMTKASSNTNVAFLSSLKGLDYCKKYNFIADAQEPVVGKNENNSLRPYSISEEDFQRHHPTICSTVQDTVDAIRYGQRVWDQQYHNLSLLDKEYVKSTFVPYGCDIPFHTPDQVCQVLNKFSHIIVQGDSLSRHLQGGLLISLRGDLVRGSLIPRASHSNISAYEQCICDGQFSEHKVNSSLCLPISSIGFAQSIYIPHSRKVPCSHRFYFNVSISLHSFFQKRPVEFTATSIINFILMSWASVPVWTNMISLSLSLTSIACKTECTSLAASIAAWAKAS